MRKNETDQREIMLDALLHSPDVSEAAKRAKVSRATLYRWLQDEVFSAELKRRRDAMLDTAVEHLKTRSGRAANVLGDMLTCTDDRLRRMAAKDILDYAFRILEGRDIIGRIEALENEAKRRSNVA